ncbi:hypothetical protein HCY81_08815 [Limosilactobacillus fermentum]
MSKDKIEDAIYTRRYLYNFHYHLIWVTKYRNPVKSYTKAAWALQNNGYATDPNYANELIYAIKKFKLDQYD